MQKMFGLLLIIVLIWFGLSAYTGDGRGGIDLGGWLDPIGGERDAEGDKLGFSEPRNGTAANAIPTPPVTAVAIVRK